MSTTTMPRVGEKVIAVSVPGRPEYDGKVCTVTGVGRTDIYGEFPSITKPDDTEMFAFLEWEPFEEPITFATKERMIGKTIRVVESGCAPEGTIGTVTGVWNFREDSYSPKIDGITVGIQYNGDQTWVQAYDVIEDGQTLTVSNVSEYRPAVGDRVEITGYLGNDGIVDVTMHTGQVTSVDGDVWMIHSGRLGHVASGPGYVHPIAELPDGDEIDLTPSQQDFTALSEKVNELTRELERANERVAEYADRAGKWERDFGRYATRVAREAVERRWCDEYERIMDEVSDDLEIAEIPKRKSRRQRTVRIRGEVWVERQVWIDEDCDDEDDPDNWYESENDDDALGSEWADERLHAEFENNGFDETEYEAQ